jgi:hypothetical protein
MLAAVSTFDWDGSFAVTASPKVTQIMFGFSGLDISALTVQSGATSVDLLSKAVN